MDHFFSTLDRMDDEFDMNKAQLTHQLLTWLDNRFCALKGEVAKLRTRARDRIRTSPSAHSKPSQHNAPPIDTVPVEQVHRQKEDSQMDLSNATNFPSTGIKRKQAPTRSATATGKRAKTPENVASPCAKIDKKHVCKYDGCGQSFIYNKDLIRHERIHLDIRPYSCAWFNCHYSATRKGHVVRHIRTQHFNLPEIQMVQAQHNIVDDRDPNDYVRVDEHLVGRRLE